MVATHASDSGERRRSASAEISNRLVRLMREWTGRGPTKARTYIHDDLVVCVLQDTLTKGERALADHGQENTVLASRRAGQSLMREEATAMIEEVLSRRVVSFMSDNATDPDIACEIFVLESRPVAKDAQSVAE